MSPPRPESGLVATAWRVNQFPRRYTFPYGTDPAAVVDRLVQRLVDDELAEVWTPFGPTVPGFWMLTDPGHRWLYRHRRLWPAPDTPPAAVAP